METVCDFRVAADINNNNRDLEDEPNLIWHLCKFCKIPFKTKEQLNVHKRTDHFQQLKELQRRKKRAQEEEEEELRQRLGTYYDIENELESEMSSNMTAMPRISQTVEEEDRMEIEDEIVMNYTSTPVIVSNDALDNRGFEFSTIAESPPEALQSNIEQDQDQDLNFEVIDLTEDEEENSSSSSFSSSSLHFPSDYSSNSSTGLLKALLSNNKDLVVVQKDVSPKSPKLKPSPPETISLLLQMRDMAFESQIKKYLNMKSDDDELVNNSNNNNNNNSNQRETNLILWKDKESERPAQIKNNNNTNKNHPQIINKEIKSIPNNNNNNHSSILRNVLTKDNNNKSTIKRQRDKTRTSLIKKYNSHQNQPHLPNSNVYSGKLDIKCKLCGGFFSGVRGLKRHLEVSHNNPIIKKGVITNEIKFNDSRKKMSQSPLHKIEGLVEHFGKERCSKVQVQLPPPPPLLLCGVHPTSSGAKRKNNRDNIIHRKKPTLKMFGDSIQIQSPQKNNNNNNTQIFHDSGSGSNSNSDSCSERIVNPISYSLKSLPSYRGHNSNPSNLNTGQLCCVNCSQNFSDVNAFAHHILRCM